uniref:Uncharacterized protein n=1 Tax=Arundo donax TaxID=35708 RepID=A0A0A9DCT9_ARUDO
MGSSSGCRTCRPPLCWSCSPCSPRRPRRTRAATRGSTPPRGAGSRGSCSPTRPPWSNSSARSPRRRTPTTMGSPSKSATAESSGAY